MLNNRLQVSHDNSGTSPGWFLDHIVLQRIEDRTMWLFPCNAWLCRKRAPDAATARWLKAAPAINRHVYRPVSRFCEGALGPNFEV